MYQGARSRAEKGVALGDSSHKSATELDLSGVYEFARPGVSKVEDREEWLKQRRKSIGASEAAVILSPNGRFGKTRATLWAEKVGLYEPENLDDIPGIRMGNAVEGIAGKVFEDEYRRDTGREVEAHVAEVTLYSKLYPFVSATPDFWLTKLFDHEVLGVLEAKAPGWIEPWKETGVCRENETLNHIWVQVQQQLYVTGLREAFLIGIGGARGGLYPFWQTIVYDDPFVQTQLLPDLEAFWECVEKEIPPDEDSTREWGKVFKDWRIREREEEPGDQILLSAEAVEASDTIEEYSARIKLMQDELQRAKNVVRKAMGDAKEAYLPNGSKWKRQKNEVLRFVPNLETEGPDA
jgi:predicted phage-related endonuclease